MRQIIMNSILTLTLSPAISWGQEYFVENSSAFSVNTTSSEIHVFNQLIPRVSQINIASLVPNLANLLSGLGCHPKGELLNNLGIANLTAVRWVGMQGALRKGQTLEIEFNICSDNSIGTAALPFYVEIKTRDLSNLGESSVFNRNTDATIIMTGPDGKSIPIIGPVYRNNGYKRALREVRIPALQTGNYQISIKAEAADVGVGYVNLHYSSSNY